MKCHPHLLAYLFRQTQPVTLLGALALALYALLDWRVLDNHHAIPALVLLAQSIALSRRLAWRQKGEAAFLYTSGFSRDTLWLHRILVTLLSGAISVALAGLIVWLGLRSALQSNAGNHLFPLMSLRENTAPLHWLAIFLLLTPLTHYAWARWEAHAAAAGYLLTIAVALTIWFCSEVLTTCELSALALAICLLLAWTGMHLHRNMEVVE